MDLLTLYFGGDPSTCKLSKLPLQDQNYHNNNVLHYYVQNKLTPVFFAIHWRVIQHTSAKKHPSYKTQLLLLFARSLTNWLIRHFFRTFADVHVKKLQQRRVHNGFTIRSRTRACNLLCATNSITGRNGSAYITMHFCCTSQKRPTGLWASRASFSLGPHNGRKERTTR